MRPTRMTIRRWMVAVALAAILTTAGLAWHRRAYYRQQVVTHALMERKSMALVLSLRPHPHTALATDVTDAVKKDMAIIERDKADPRHLMAVGGPAAGVGIIRRFRFQEAVLQEAEADLRRAEELLENVRKKAEAQAVYHGGLRKKYDQAAARPLLPVPPDPPPP